MYQAGIEEKQKAISNGHVDPDGIPYITVAVDGSWAKRSYIGLIIMLCLAYPV